jgi:hypothetical protein
MNSFQVESVGIPLVARNVDELREERVEPERRTRVHVRAHAYRTVVREVTEEGFRGIERVESRGEGVDAVCGGERAGKQARVARNAPPARGTTVLEPRIRTGDEPGCEPVEVVLPHGIETANDDVSHGGAIVFARRISISQLRWTVLICRLEIG